ncbi:hypothetical protein [Chitinophaga sp. 212800010-3]|uniref:hypothetical protein n=1 Tax=unclassified Chitinophaga TaxID=2619133 RepID=UPI002E0E0C8E
MEIVAGFALTYTIDFIGTKDGVTTMRFLTPEDTGLKFCDTWWAERRNKIKIIFYMAGITRDDQKSVNEVKTIEYDLL